MHGYVPVTIVIAALCTTVFARDARAQAPVDSVVSHMGVGVGVNFYHPSSSDGEPSQGITFVYRWHSFHSGWGPTFGLDWRTTDFNQPVGSVDAPLGSLRMRALLAGYGHTRRLGRFSASASVSGGYSFNHLSVADGAGPAFASNGMSLIGVDVNNSLVLKPDAAVWYDVGKHTGVGISVSYLVARPEETVTTATGSDTRRLRADTFAVTAGLVFGVWKKQ